MSPNKRLLRIELVRCLDCPYFRHYPAAGKNDGCCQIKHKFQFSIVNMNTIDERCPLDILHPERPETIEEIRAKQMLESPQYMIATEE